MASAWGSSWSTAWLDSWGATGGTPAPTPTPTAGKRKRAMYPGGWLPDRLYQPPRRKLKKSALKALKELYEEVKSEIPTELQRGLIPPEVLFRSRAVTRLPPAEQINFDALARSFETIRILIAALEAQREEERIEEQKRLRRRREEEIVMHMLMEIFD